MHDIAGPDPAVSDVVAAALAGLGAPIETARTVGTPPKLIAELEARNRLYRQGQM